MLLYCLDPCFIYVYLYEMYIVIDFYMIVLLPSFIYSELCMTANKSTQAHNVCFLRFHNLKKLEIQEKLIFSLISIQWRHDIFTNF